MTATIVVVLAATLIVPAVCLALYAPPKSSSAAD
jgi:hypothetical protein